MDLNIKGKIVVKTGGTGVLGGSASDSLAKAGLKIAIIGREQATIDTKVNSIKDNGGQAYGISGDILDKESIQQALNKIINHYGGIDIIINAAGGNMPGATIGPDQTIFDIKLEDFKKVTDLNLNGTIIPSLVFGEYLAAQNKG